MTTLKQFFEKRDICIDEIMYICKTPGTSITEFHLDGGRIETRYVSMKEVKSILPDYFVTINKGIIVNINYIKYINRYIYHMKDGIIFDGKLKDQNLHKSIKQKIGEC